VEIYTGATGGTSALTTNNTANLEVQNVSLYGVGPLINNNATTGGIKVNNSFLGVKAAATTATSDINPNDFSQVNPMPTTNSFFNKTCIEAGQNAQINNNFIRCWAGINIESATTNAVNIAVNNNDFSVANSGVSMNKYGSSSNAYAAGNIIINDNVIHLQSIADNGSPRLSKDGIHFESKNNPTGTGVVDVYNNTIQGINVSNDNGIYVRGNTASGSTNNIVRQIRSNTFKDLQAGILVSNSGGTDGVKISTNTFTGQIGIPIDLSAQVVIDGPTANDGLVTGYGVTEVGNRGYDYPYITEAKILGSNLTLKGCAFPGSQIEFYKSGATLAPLTSILIEGSAADTDAGINQTCSQSVTGTPYNVFNFVIPVGSISVNDQIRAIATNPTSAGPYSSLGSNSTSEFGNTAVVTNVPTGSISCQNIYFFQVLGPIATINEYVPGVTINPNPLAYNNVIGPTFRNAAGLTPLANKIFYNRVDNTVGWYDTSNNAINTIPTSPTFVSARGATDSIGDYWTINSTNTTLYRFSTGTSPALASTQTITYTTSTVPSDGGGDIAITQNGKIYFISNSNQLFIINKTNAQASYLGVITGVTAGF